MNINTAPLQNTDHITAMMKEWRLETVRRNEYYESQSVFARKKAKMAELAAKSPEEFQKYMELKYPGVKFNVSIVTPASPVTKKATLVKAPVRVSLGSVPYTLADGTEIRITALAVGGKVWINEKAPKAGTYKLQDGSEITVDAAGNILSVNNKKPVFRAAEKPVQSVTNHGFKMKFDKTKEDQIKSAVSNLKTALEDKEAMKGYTGKEQSTLKSLFQAFKKLF